MNRSTKEDLSLQLRIPANEAFLPNAIATIEGICEHFEVCTASAANIVSTINQALLTSFELTNLNPDSLLSLHFFVNKPLLKVELSNIYSQHQQSVHPIAEASILKQLNKIKALTNNFSCRAEGQANTIFSMQFSLTLN